MDNDMQSDPSTIRMAYFALLLSGRRYDNLELAVAQEMLKMNRLTAERSLPTMIGNSVRIAATINSIEFEESSKRYLIKFMADNGDGEEHVRSERTDSSHKDAVKKIWQRDLVGGQLWSPNLRNETAMDSTPHADAVSGDAPVRYFSPAARRVRTAAPVCNIQVRAI